MFATSDTATAVFHLDAVHYAYHGQAALHDLSLTIQRGQRVALLGANGSGKSTLLRLLDGLYFAQQGILHAFGQPLTEAALQHDAAAFAFRRRVGLVFQNAEVQLFNPTVFDELAFGPLQLGWPAERIRQRIDVMLAQFAIAHLRDRPPQRLSGGEKKRVALAAVLMTEPEVLLLDEPCSGLDPASQDAMEVFLAHRRDPEQTLVLATHDLESVAAIADHCVVLHAGRVAAQGTPAQILADEALLRSCRLLRGSRPGLTCDAS